MNEVPFTSIFGNNLKRLRTQRRISQAEMARLMGTKRNQVWRLENETSNPKLSTLTKICEILDVNYSELLELPSS